MVPQAAFLPPEPVEADDDDSLDAEPRPVERQSRETLAVSESMMSVRQRRSVRSGVRRSVRAIGRAADAVGDAIVDAVRPDPIPPPPPRPEATPGMTPLPEGISAARSDVALPVDPTRLLHVEQQLLPADTAAAFRVQLRSTRPDDPDLP